MKTPDKIFVSKDLFRWSFNTPTDKSDMCYINKDVLNELLDKELNRLWELIPYAENVENETCSPMEYRYLGEYMAIERIIDTIKEL